MRVLLIEDDTTLGRALHEFLGSQGYAADWLHSGEPLGHRVSIQVYDLLLLDLNLPGIGGLEILRRLRAQGYEGRILILTARDALEDRVAGLDAGADDYLTKPFELAELAARIRALARRHTGHAAVLLEYGPLAFDTVSRQLRVDGLHVALSVRELSVLEMLLAQAGQVVTKQQMVQSLSAVDADFSENAVEVYIYRLRKRLDGTAAHIRTVRGFGYLLEVDADAAPA